MALNIALFSCIAAHVCYAATIPVESNIPKLDSCGICEGNEAACSECTIFVDCHGECGGTSLLDACGVCDGDSSSCTGCIDPQACNINVYATLSDSSLCTYGSLVSSDFDCWGNCISEYDCEGVCGGTAQNDECGVCGANGASCTPGFCADGTVDCSGNCITATNKADTTSNDACGVCGGDSSTCTGCKDSAACNYDEDATYYGICEYPIADGFSCSGGCLLGSEADCTGQCGGTLTLDGCGVCGGDSASCMSCDDNLACNYDENLYYPPNTDICTYPDKNYNCDGHCTGVVDCLGNCEGGSVEDVCGVCGGDSSSCAGCHDMDACNYSPLTAASDDSLCTYGRTLSAACLDEGSCQEYCDADGECNYFFTESQDDNPLDCWGKCSADIDCAGTCDGLLVIDACGVCGGNGTYDCAGDCGGSATEDVCGVCNGDGSSCTGCMDSSACNYMSYAVINDDDACIYGTLFSPCESKCGDADYPYDCFGTCLLDFDCLGICDGSAQEDMCGICDGANQHIDCNGDCGGVMAFDECGICGGDSSTCEGCSDESACNYNSLALIQDSNKCTYADKGYDCFGSCVAETDCNGDCGGGVELNSCGVCSLSEDSCAEDYCTRGFPDCEGTCNGLITVDECGVCGGDSSACVGCTDITACNYNPEATIEDKCWYNPDNYDCNGQCVAYDCTGECGGSVETDGCGICGGGGQLIDCLGKCLGTAILDVCGVCGGDESTCVGCFDSDACNYFESATISNDLLCTYPEQYLDCFGNCAVDKDCEGTCAGTVEEDLCGVCNGDNTACQGCTDTNACNFDQYAKILDGSCTYPDTEVLDCFGNCAYESDCLGVCAGTTAQDECGICGGDGSCCRGQSSPGTHYGLDAKEENVCDYTDDLGVCYIFQATAATLENAQDICANMGGYVATPSTKLASLNLNTIARNDYGIGSDGRLWLGITAINDCEWTALDEASFDLVWDSGEPNGCSYCSAQYESDGECCAEIRSSNKLNDISCGNEFNYFCETYPYEGLCDLILDGVCYTYMPGDTSMALAQAECEAIGGDVAFSNDEVILSELNNIAVNTYGHTATWWIGINAQDNDCDWEALDGQGLTYTNWNDGEPNGCSSCSGLFMEDGECCAHVYTDGAWNDATCANSYTYFCERTFSESSDYCEPNPTNCDLNENGVCYSLVNEEATMSDAENYCQTMGGHVAYSTDSSLLDTLNSFAQDQGVTNSFWLGAEAIGDCEWYPFDGQSFGYSNWNDGEPNGCSSCAGDIDDNNECCAHIYTSGLWNDATCANTYAYFCAVPICDSVRDCDYIDEDGTCYVWHHEKYALQTANDICQIGGGSVGLPATSDAALALNDIAVNTYGSEDTWWLGINARQYDCDFYALNHNQQEFSYTNWADDEPNGCSECSGYFSTDGECCTHVYSSGTWNDASCGNSYNFFCEYADDVAAETCDLEDGDLCYKFVSEPKTLSDAQIDCRAMNGYVATPSSETELLTLNSVVELLDYTDTWWIGINARQNECVFSPLQEMSDVFYNWNEDEPNGCDSCIGEFQTDGECCTHVYTDSTYNDATCGNEYAYFCVIDMSATTCEGICGEIAPSSLCGCDAACYSLGDCCPDVNEFCDYTSSCYLPDGTRTDSCCFDGILNGQEEGIDCGGTCGQACDECQSCDVLDCFGACYTSDEASNAVQKDGCGVCGGDSTSCIGCLDSTACNYDQYALLSSDTCTYISDPLYDCFGNCVFVDCDGVCGGSSERDACGVCNGDSDTCDGCTDELACNYDETAVFDDGACFNQESIIVDCFGNCLVDLDCAGTCGGTAEADACGVCDGNDESIDCRGMCSGTATIDICGICDGDSDTCSGCIDPDACNYDSTVTYSDGSCYYEDIYDCNGLCRTSADCASECGGSAVEDECGVCGGFGSTCNDDYCSEGTIDCAGECDGHREKDDCGICGIHGSENWGSNDCDTLCEDIDCFGVCGGTAIEDSCGICNGYGDICAEEPFCSDTGDVVGCNGECNSGITTDACGTCGGDSSDCTGCSDSAACTYFEDRLFDDDNFCTYPEENYDCAGVCAVDIDCLNTCGGTAMTDICGVCGGGGKTMDCDGVCGGGATEDECGVCNGDGFSCNEGGCTDKNACNYFDEATLDDGTCWYASDMYGDGYDCFGNCDSNFDCSGTCGGQQVGDACGVCGGDSSDIDCFGNCFGTAELDSCDVCGGDGSLCGDCPTVDCAGICDGSHSLDTSCSPEVCSAGGVSKDCEGVCFGTTVYDKCGECGGDGSSCVGCMDTNACNYDSSMTIQGGFPSDSDDSLVFYIDAWKETGNSASGDIWPNIFESATYLTWTQVNAESRGTFILGQAAEGEEEYVTFGDFSLDGINEDAFENIDYAYFISDVSGFPTGTDAFTWEFAFAKGYLSGEDEFLFSYGEGATGQDNSVYIDADGYLCHSFGCSSTAVVISESDININVVVVIFDGSSITFYLNGKLTDDLSTNGAEVTPENGKPFVVGGGTTDANSITRRSFTGALYYLRLYDTALDGTIVSTHYEETDSSGFQYRTSKPCVYAFPSQYCDGTCDVGLELDCAGLCGGITVVDGCDVCGGDAKKCSGCVDRAACNFDAAATVKDDTQCEFPRENYDCNGACLEVDCNGQCGGSAVIDECGICGGFGASCHTCDGEDCPYCENGVVDCAGECDGTRVFDSCDVCAGDGSICGGDDDDDDDDDESSDCDEWDCKGVCGGSSVMDSCDVCGGNGQSCTFPYCENDSVGCDGECGSSAQYDDCGVCNGNGLTCVYPYCGPDSETDCDSCLRTTS